MFSWAVILFYNFALLFDGVVVVKEEFLLPISAPYIVYVLPELNPP